jgi:hypothetical protein
MVTVDTIRTPAKRRFQVCTSLLVLLQQQIVCEVLLPNDAIFWSTKGRTEEKSLTLKVTYSLKDRNDIYSLEIFSPRPVGRLREARE